MIKKAKLFYAIAALMFLTVSVEAKIKAPFGSYEKVKKVANLPDLSNYVLEDGTYMDLGIRYSVFQILYLPIYQQEEAILVGYDESKNSYIELSQDELAIIFLDSNINFVEINSIPFWDAWGGKIVLVVILLGTFFSLLKKVKKIYKKIKENQLTKEAI